MKIHNLWVKQGDPDQRSKESVSTTRMWKRKGFSLLGLDTFPGCGFGCNFCLHFLFPFGSTKCHFCLFFQAFCHSLLFTNFDFFHHGFHHF
mmetsp:Transcript_48299/g.140876  ORF Transcript_48299/g.140876 Transcript_48299/m.140876 type:complete len:91 (-) Transcript_48299:877-1149(-)